MQRKLVPAPLTVDMISADCKVMHLHEKPSVSVLRPSSTYMHKVYTAKQFTARHGPNSRVSSNAIGAVKVKKRTPSPSKAVIQDSSGVTRSLPNMQSVNKSLPGNSFDSGVKVSHNGDIVSMSKNANSSEGNGKKATKVFLSEKQSRSLRDCGVLVPCAPPVTPTPEHRQKIVVIPSLTDVRAQRHMRQRLEGITKNDTRKQEKKREEMLRHEKMTTRERIVEQKKRQRQEIYALNRVMTDLEYKHFEDFVKEKGFNE